MPVGLYFQSLLFIGPGDPQLCLSQNKTNNHVMVIGQTYCS
jgi:hypothetical protein